MIASKLLLEILSLLLLMLPKTHVCGCLKGVNSTCMNNGSCHAHISLMKYRLHWSYDQRIQSCGVSCASTDPCIHAEHSLTLMGLRKGKPLHLHSISLKSMELCRDPLTWSDCRIGAQPFLTHAARQQRGRNGTQISWLLVQCPVDI